MSVLMGNISSCMIPVLILETTYERCNSSSTNYCEYELFTSSCLYFFNISKYDLLKANFDNSKTPSNCMTSYCRKELLLYLKLMNIPHRLACFPISELLPFSLSPLCSATFDQSFETYDSFLCEE